MLMIYSDYGYIFPLLRKCFIKQILFEKKNQFLLFWLANKMSFDSKSVLEKFGWKEYFLTIRFYRCFELYFILFSLLFFVSVCLCVCVSVQREYNKLICLFYWFMHWIFICAYSLYKVFTIYFLMLFIYFTIQRPRTWEEKRRYFYISSSLEKERYSRRWGKYCRS